MGSMSQRAWEHRCLGIIDRLVSGDMRPDVQSQHLRLDLGGFGFNAPLSRMDCLVIPPRLSSMS